METGDLILFSGTSCSSCLLECCGCSQYSHVGMVISNPRFFNSELPDGMYILESGRKYIPDSEQHTLKNGVQLHLLSDFLETCPKQSVYIRRISCERNDSFYEKLSQLYSKIRNQPYDMNVWDWIRAEYNLFFPLPISPSYQFTDRYWCSALIAYLLFHLQLIEPVNWSFVAPREFSAKGTQITFTVPIGPEELLW